MSQTINCDGGCGFTSTKIKDFRVLGLVTQREYCEKCAVHVVQFLEDRDTLHTALAAEWGRKNRCLKTNFKSELPNGTLPDE